ncbi:MAG: heterodisulfide reductase-related iron-sulfur binding cluster [Candidatus Desulfacyla sp.]
MKYFLYWGCSLEGTGANFLVSLKPPCEALGMEFEEIEDWNCCGASVSYAGANDLAIKVLNARNLALAEAHAGYDIVAPCSSCYIPLGSQCDRLVDQGLGDPFLSCYCFLGCLLQHLLVMGAHAHRKIAYNQRLPGLR